MKRRKKKKNVELAKELRSMLGNEKYDELKILARALRSGDLTSSSFLRRCREELRVSPSCLQKMIETLPDESLQKELKRNINNSTCLIVIHFHHILSELKREMILDVARELDVHFCISKYGTPGVVIIEAPTESVESFLSILRSQRWQTMDIRACRTVLCDLNRDLRCNFFFPNPERRIVELKAMKILWYELEVVEKHSKIFRDATVHGDDFNGLEYVQNAILSNRKIPRKCFSNPKRSPDIPFVLCDGIPPDFLHSRTYSEIRAEKDRQSRICGLD